MGGLRSRDVIVWNAARRKRNSPEVDLGGLRSGNVIVGDFLRSRNVIVGKFGQDYYVSGPFLGVLGKILLRLWRGRGVFREICYLAFWEEVQGCWHELWDQEAVHLGFRRTTVEAGICTLSVE